MRRRFVAALAVAAVTGFAGSQGDLWAGAAKDKDKGPHLRYVKTWAEALAEGKARNTLVFATFHKDN